MHDLTVAEIKEIRQRYGLSQRSFATLLGIGVASITRYENGAKPTKANMNLIRAAQDPSFMQGCLERDGGSIPPSQKKKAQQYVYAYVDLEGKENAPVNKMTEIYEFTLQQEVLNEQAANIACEIIRYMVKNNISDDDSPLGALLSKLYEVKGFIISRESRDQDALDQVRGFLKYTEEYVHDFVSMRKAA